LMSNEISKECAMKITVAFKTVRMFFLLAHFT